uniref:Carboxypeptidase n=1 Tax=Lygus hesperus TaxID=30085 RepID=A0A0A9W3V6_LYGHE
MYGMKGTLVSLLLLYVGPSIAFRNPYPKTKALYKSGLKGSSEKVGKPLYLSPYIESRRIAEGQAAALVPPILDNITSYAGFLTVNKQFNSNLFFWYFPAEESPLTAPVAVWLQGGPGASSMYGLFTENGPYIVKHNGKVERRPHPWSRKLNMIFLDQPVGTGFSFTRDEAGYANSVADAGRDVYNALLQFFQLFPKIAKNDFIITGESYGGKWIPAVGYTIHQGNKKNGHKINLKGMAIGNGWVDPYNMLDYSTLYYDLYFIDLKTKRKFAQIEERIKSLMERKNYKAALALKGEYFDDDASLVPNVTGVSYLYNFLNPQKVSDDAYIEYLNQPTIRKNIHVGKLPYNDESDVVAKHMELDDVISILPWLEELMDHYKVLLYSGQLDIICAYPLMMNYVRKLKWKGADSYKKAERKQWHVGNELAGYSKTAGNFTELLVLAAGHMVPRNQPVWALDMITNFAFN